VNYQVQKKKNFFFSNIYFIIFKDFVNKVEKTSTNGQYDNKNVIQTITKQSHTSPILHRLLTSPAKLNETSILTNQNDYIDNDNNKSPQYRPRYSPFYVPETKNNTKFISKDSCNRNCKTSRQSCRSPVFTRRPPQQDQTIIENDNDNRISQCDSSIQSMALISLDTNGILPINETYTNNSSSSLANNNNKRSLESSSSEQVLIKRRYQKSVPSKFIFNKEDNIFVFLLLSYSYSTKLLYIISE
jgi:hypothetical protein